MTSTPPDQPPTSITGNDSWVDLSTSTSGPVSPNRVTPIPFGGEFDYLRMLREAQKESNRSSAKVSPISSALMSISSTQRNTPISASPKSPPNSPNTERVDFEKELKDYYINREKSDQGGVTPADFLWDWSSKPTGKDWVLPQSVRCRKPSDTGSGISNSNNFLVLGTVGSGKSSSNVSNENFDGERKAKSKDKDNNKGFGKPSKRLLYTILLTNIVSLLIGAGIGMWISKRSSANTMDGVLDIAL